MQERNNAKIERCKSSIANPRLSHAKVIFPWGACWRGYIFTATCITDLASLCRNLIVKSRPQTDVAPPYNGIWNWFCWNAQWRIKISPNRYLVPKAMRRKMESWILFQLKMAKYSRKGFELLTLHTTEGEKSLPTSTNASSRKKVKLFEYIKF